MSINFERTQIDSLYWTIADRFQWRLPELRVSFTPLDIKADIRKIEVSYKDRNGIYKAEVLLFEEPIYKTGVLPILYQSPKGDYQKINAHNKIDVGITLIEAIVTETNWSDHLRRHKNYL